MNKDILKGQWRQVRGEIRKQWGKLTDDELEMIQGDYDKLIGKVQEKYGYSREEAQREVDSFYNRYDRGMSV